MAALTRRRTHSLTILAKSTLYLKAEQLSLI